MLWPRAHRFRLLALVPDNFSILWPSHGRGVGFRVHLHARLAYGGQISQGQREIDRSREIAHEPDGRRISHLEVGPRA